MMKHNVKTTGATLLAGMLMFLSLVPFGALAEERNARFRERQSERLAANASVRKDRENERQAASCERLIGVIDRHMTGLDERRARFAEHFGDTMTAFAERRDDRDAKLNDRREKQDEMRSEWYMKLEAKATTDEQRAALEKFKKASEQAVIAKRKAINDTIANFREAIDRAIASKKQTAFSSAESFQSTVRTAFEKAKTSCESGVEPQIVRDALKASVKDAHADLEEKRRSFERVGDTVSELAKTKNAALKKAQDDFRVSMERARDTLKAAFDAADAA
jgi:hypothetical protein